VEKIPQPTTSEEFTNLRSWNIFVNSSRKAVEEKIPQPTKNESETNIRFS